MAGSVIPSNAVTPEGIATPLSLVSFVITPTAKAAAPCAMLDIAAIGKIKVPPVVTISASS
ncbi:Uncharacterised protein [Vibrio cholerae]|nr:Uncharacterised protein [Vibrio cholerae]